MADRTYELTFALSDGSEKKVQFTAPQGEPGKDGYTPVKGKDYNDGADGVGITNISIQEV